MFSHNALKAQNNYTGWSRRLKRAYALRDRTIADPSRMTADPAMLLGDARLAREAERIDMRRAALQPAMLEQGDTIWMGAIDGDDLAVSMIQSVFWDYGSGLVLPRTGILMQNRGMAFSLDEKSHRAMAPGRLPFHNAQPLHGAVCGWSPSFLRHHGRGCAAANPCTGLLRIRSGVPLAEALDRPRFLWGLASGAPSGGIRFENRFDPDVLARLESLGHIIAVERCALWRQFRPCGGIDARGSWRNLCRA